MEKPIFTFKERSNWVLPEFEIAKMRVIREINNSTLGRACQRTVELLSRLLYLLHNK